MTPDEYRAALCDLGLTQAGAAPVLGVSTRTAEYYAQKGPSAPAALAIRLLLALRPEDRVTWLRPT